MKLFRCARLWWIAHSVVKITLLVLLFACIPSVDAQAPSHDPSSSAIIPVFVTDKHSNAPVTSLKASDFDVASEHSSLHVNSLASSASEAGVRPLTIWFVYQCPQEGIAFSWVSYGSGFMKGKAGAFTPVLQKLGAHDTVGVAHWCDNGTLAVDLPPTWDRSAPAAAIETGMNVPMAHTSDQPGQNALHDVFLRIRQATLQIAPDSLPVFIFLYGDHSGMYHQQVAELLNPSLGPMPVVYGINNGAVSIQAHPITDQYTQLYVVHFLAEKTGGQVLSTFRGNYAQELEKILTELQGRYELAFSPPGNNKEREIRVKLNSEARRNFRSAELRSPSIFALPTSDKAGPYQDLQTSLLAVVRTGTPYTDLAFDASCKKAATTDATAQCRLYIDPTKLTWAAQENGERQSELVVATANVSVQGSIVATDAKKFQAVQSKADQSGNPKAVILNLAVPVEAEAARLQFVLQDLGSRKIGSFSVSVSQIRVLASKGP